MEEIEEKFDEKDAIAGSMVSGIPVETMKSIYVSIDNIKQKIDSFNSSIIKEIEQYDDDKTKNALFQTFINMLIEPLGEEAIKSSINIDTTDIRLLMKKAKNGLKKNEEN